MENGGSGGSDALTPETVLAAEGPSLEALGTRGGRGVGSCEKDMGLDGAGGAELAPDGDVEALRRLERTLGENRVPTAYGAPLRGREDLAGSSCVGSSSRRYQFLPKLGRDRALFYRYLVF